MRSTFFKISLSIYNKNKVENPTYDLEVVLYYLILNVRNSSFFILYYGCI
jgi:hypothetical protein